MAHDLEMQELLTAVTEALLRDEAADIQTLSGRYAVAADESAGYLLLIQRLKRNLTAPAPSKRFTRRLKHELVGVEPTDLVSRVRYLPPRVQIAAGIALMATFMLLLRRRLTFGARRDDEVPALQQ